MARRGPPSSAEEASVEYRSDRVYVVDEDYRDSTDRDANEFHRWIGVKNSGGIRPLLRRADGEIAALVLVSTHVSVATYNPWEDVIDPMQGRIWYWGDAKASKSKGRDDWQGNKYLQRVWSAVGEGRWRDVPPILHFSKPAKGTVRFTGLCALTNLSDAWMEDRGKRVRNYLAQLDILEVRELPVGWLRARALGLRAKAPPEWSSYLATGVPSRLVAYAKNVRKREEQLPDSSAQMQLLHNLNEIDPFKFERLIVKAFQSLDISHDIRGTRKVADGGFDFYGSFRLPPPLSYSIDMKGEVKRYKPDGGGVGVKEVARLVARLQRGEHGVFATNAYFTQQAQREIFEDHYPVELIHGGRLLGLLTRVGAIKGGGIDADWIR